MGDTGRGAGVVAGDEAALDQRRPIAASLFSTLLLVLLRLLTTINLPKNLQEKPYRLTMTSAATKRVMPLLRGPNRRSSSCSRTTWKGS